MNCINLAQEETSEILRTW